VIDQVLKSIDPERRLRGVEIEESIDVGGSRVMADEDLLVSALSGLLIATASLTEGQPDARIAVFAQAHGDEVVFGMAQVLASAPSDWATRTVALAAGSRMAAAWGGRLTATATTHGSGIRVALPRLA
jgi:hypothetical protein